MHLISDPDGNGMIKWNITVAAPTSLRLNPTYSKVRTFNVFISNYDFLNKKYGKLSLYYYFYQFFCCDIHTLVSVLCNSLPCTVNIDILLHPLALCI